MDISSIDKIIKSGNPLIWIDTKEYNRCIEYLSNISEQINKGLFVWDSCDGLINKKNNNGKIDDGSPFKYFKTNEIEDTILILEDFHEFLKEPEDWRALANSIAYNIPHNNSIVIVSPVVKIPSEIEHYITVIEMKLPTQEDFEKIIESIIEKEQDIKGKFKISEKEKKLIANAGLGLTKYEFENAIYLSIENGSIDKKFVYEQKKQLIEKNSNIKISNTEETLDTLIGMDNMKHFATTMALSGQGRGILIIGIPGGGKTEFAKRLGNKTNRLTISIDFGDLMGSYVGETERKTKEALKIIDTISPSIVFIDEIEKGLSGTSSTDGDSVSKRQGGQFLKWMQDHKSDAYVIATANKIDNLPPEFLRSGRWDAIFFVDMLSKNNKRKVLELYKGKFDITDDIDIENMDYTGAEIETLCRLAKNLKISLKEAKSYVCPIVKTMEKDIATIKEIAKTIAVPADINGSDYKNNNEESKTINRRIRL